VRLFFRRCIEQSSRNGKASIRKQNREAIHLDAEYFPTRDIRCGILDIVQRQSRILFGRRIGDDDADQRRAAVRSVGGATAAFVKAIARSAAGLGTSDCIDRKSA